MIDSIDIRLHDWVSRLLEGVPVSMAAPTESVSGVSVFLMDLRCETPGRGKDRPPLSLSLRYLISVTDADPANAHQMLWKLLVDSMGGVNRGEWVVEPDSPPLELWTALKAVPRPAFVLKVPAWQEWEAPPVAPLVKERLKIDAQPMMRLHGTILANGNMSMGALVVVGDHSPPKKGFGPENATAITPTLMAAVAEHPRTYSDSNGRFSFSLPGGERAPRWLLVKVKRQSQFFQFDPSQSSDLKLEVTLKET